MNCLKKIIDLITTAAVIEADAVHSSLVRVNALPTVSTTTAEALYTTSYN